MASQNEGHEAATRRVLEAQTHGWNHIFSFINSMSLRSAIELNIPDIIHRHGKPMPLHLLASSLKIQPSKAPHLRRLMRFLTHTGFFSLQKLPETSDDSEGYVLTDASTLFLKDHPFTLAPLSLGTLDPLLLKPWEHLPAWFQNNDPTPFETAHGKAIYDYASQVPRTLSHFNDYMAGDSKLVGKVLVEQCRDVFKGCGSLVDVGGNTGTMAKALAEAFPEMECTVFDLPYIVGGLKDCGNLKFVQGDMFQTIPPPADIIMLKWTLCDWDDERCLTLLKNCKEAVTSKSKPGKLVLIDAVVEDDKADYDYESVETLLQFDLATMVLLPGKERNEKEWAHLLTSAGFTTYKITPILANVCFAGNGGALWKAENPERLGGDYFLCRYQYLKDNSSSGFKWILCDSDDESRLKILKNGKEAVTSKGKRGKLVLINEVVNDEKANYDELVETQLQFDLALMALLPGKERNEKEWAHLLSSAGFSSYKITPVLGIRSLIEVFP